MLSVGTRREKGTGAAATLRLLLCPATRVRFCPLAAPLSSKALGDFQIDNSACIAIFLKHGLKSSLPTPIVSLEDCGHARRRGRKAEEKRREKGTRKDEEESKGEMQGRTAAGRGERWRGDSRCRPLEQTPPLPPWEL